MSKTLGPGHRTWVDSPKRIIIMTLKSKLLHLGSPSSSCVTRVLLTTTRTPRQETKPFCQPSWPPACGRRCQGLEGNSRNQPGADSKGLAHPTGHPHGSWDIFSDILLLATEGCLIHSHRWGCLYATSFSEHPAECRAQSRAWWAGGETGGRDSISGPPPNSPLKERAQSFAEWPPSPVERPLLFLLILPCL